MILHRLPRSQCCFGILGALAFWFGAFSVVGFAAEEEVQRPNILWITCEDLTPILGCYGDPVADTPNLDWLASEGIRYENAYSVAGVCAPSRHALITGMYPTSTGGHNMRTVHNMVSDLPDYGVVLPPEVKCFSEWLRRAGYYCTNNAKTDYQFQPPLSAWDESDQDAHWRKRPEGVPFFAVINFLTTHESRVWTQAHEPLLVDESAVPVPPYLPDLPDVRRDVARKYSNTSEMDRQVGIILEQLRKDGLLDDTIIFFFSDHGGMLPREKRELYDSGMRVPLIVRFPDKWRAGEWEDELVSFVDFAPTVLSLAGIEPPSYLQGQAFLGSFDSGEDRKYVFGARDRMDTEYDRVRAVRSKRYKYLRNYRPELPYVQKIEYRENMAGMRAFIQAHEAGKLSEQAALWWRDHKPVEELFDTEADPNEFHNLADDPDYQQVLEEHRAAMDDWLETYGDMGAIPERELIYDVFWKGDSQPVTASVSAEWMEGRLHLTCSTEGSSIVWRYKGEGNPDQWFLYVNPFVPAEGKTIEARANRIGFKLSELLLVE